MREANHTYLLDYTTGAVKEVMHYLQRTVEETRTLTMLPHCEQRLSLEQIYIPVRVSQKRLTNMPEQLGQEIARRNGQRDEPKKAYGRTEDAYRQLAEQTEEVVLRWENARKTYRKVVILGDPGQGKTTLLTWERWKAASESLEKLNKQEVGLSGIEVPIYVRLAEVAKSGLEIDAYVFNELRKRNTPENFLTWLAGAMDRGQVVFLLDALDEVHQNDLRDALDKELDVLLSRFSKCRYVLTSRIVGYRGCAVERQGKAMELVLLGARDIEKFVQSWFADDASKRRGFLQALRTTPTLNNLAANPLLLSLLCMVYNPNSGLPHRATDLYQRCLERFLRDWRGNISEERFVEKLEVLETAAFELWVQGKEYFSAQELKASLGKSSRYQSLLAQAPNGSLIHELTNEDGILIKAGSDTADVPYMFLHLTFQEYLTARAIAQQINAEGWNTKFQIGRKQVSTLTLIDKKSWDPVWQEVIGHLVGQLIDPFPVLKLLCNKQSDDRLRHRIRLASLCLPEIEQERRGEYTDRIAEEILELVERDTSQMVDRYLPIVASVSARIIKQVFERLEDKEINVISRAAEILGKMGWPAIADGRLVPALLKRLEHENRYVRRSVTAALGKLGQAVAGDRRVILALLERLQDEEWIVRTCAAEALGEMGQVAACDSRVISTLLQGLKTESEYERSRITEVVKALNEIHKDTSDDSSVIIRLLQRLEQQNRYVRRSAAYALMKMGDAVSGDRRVISALSQHLKDEDDQVRYWTTLALAIMGQPVIADSRVIARLRLYLEEGDERMRQPAATALTKMGQPVAPNALLIEKLLQHLRDQGHGSLRVKAAGDLGNLGRLAAEDIRVIPALVQRLRDQHEFVRFKAAEALGKMCPAAVDDDTVVPELLHRLKDEDSIVRGGAAYALGEIAQTDARTRAVPALLPMLQDEDHDVRIKAITALGKMGVRVFDGWSEHHRPWKTIEDLSKL